MILRTKPGIQHIQCHGIALCSTCNRNETLVTVILWLIDLDDTTAQLSNFVDLSTSFTNDGANHIIRDIDVLGDGLTRH